MALTPSKKTLNQLALSWGTKSYLMPFSSSFDDMVVRIKKLLIHNKLAKKGEMVVIVGQQRLYDDAPVVVEEETRNQRTEARDDE